MAKDFISRVGTYFSVSGEMIPENGEDSYLYFLNENKGMVGVFDGCGGIGSRRYPTLDSKTGAYISSRVVSECVAKWFEDYSLQEDTEDKTAGIIREISKGLDAFKTAASESRMKGSMTRDFPTTLAMTVLEQDKNKILADFIWAGDSRGYVLDAQGLVQITRDDIDETVDALDNISSDGVLTNHVSAGNDYELHSKKVQLTKRCIVFNATDGCFGYLKTPMEFEYLILCTLAASRSVNEWKERLDTAIRKYTGDDYTISLVALDFGSFNEMKEYYRKRTRALREQYIKPLKDCTEEDISILWEKYKKVYYRKV